jgi:hypothetical protein
MKRVVQITSFLLVLSFLIGIFSQSYLIISFYLNRAEITEKHCVNKEKPELECAGQCHLKKQLEATKPTKELNNDLPNSPRTFLLMFGFFQTKSTYQLLAKIKPNKKHFFSVPNHYTDGFRRKILHPPIIS